MGHDTFCAVPWIELSTKPNGNIRICCLMSNSADPDKGVLRSSNGEVLNLSRADIGEAMNVEKIRDLRLDLLAGKRNELCKTCWQKEDVHLGSKRQFTNRRFAEVMTREKAESVTAADGSIPEFKPAYLDLRLGNLCNLKCVMCHPASSSKWYSDYVKLTGETYFNDTREKIQLRESSPGNYVLEGDEYSWHQNEEVWTQLSRISANLKQIYLVGGEPLLIDPHYRYIESLVEQGLAKDIVLEYDSNMTVLPERALAIWPHFKKVLLRISAESIGEVNDYIRYPSNWEKIDANIQTARRRLSNAQIEFSSTWQIYNLTSITKAWDYFEGQGSTRILSSPSQLSVQYLPSSLKRAAIEHLCQSPHKKLSEPLIRFLEANMDCVDSAMLDRFLEYTRKLDTIRGLDFAKLEPQLVQAIEEVHV